MFWMEVGCKKGFMLGVVVGLAVSCLARQVSICYKLVSGPGGPVVF